MLQTHIIVATPRPANELAGLHEDDEGAGCEVLAGAAVLIPVVRLVWTDKVRNVWKCVFGFLM